MELNYEAGLAIVVVWDMFLRNVYSGLRWYLAVVAFYLWLAGVFANWLVIFLNGGMPVHGLSQVDGYWIPMTDSTILPVLGDIIYLPSSTASFGDIMMDVALVLLGAYLVIALYKSFTEKPRHVFCRG